NGSGAAPSHHNGDDEGASSPPPLQQRQGSTTPTTTSQPCYNCTQSTSKINKGYVVLPQQLLRVLYYNVLLLAVGSVVQSLATSCGLCITILAGCCALRK